MTGLPPGPHRICAVVDVEAYSGRTPTQQLRIQSQIRDIVDHACARASVTGSDRQDRGDGQLIVLPTGVDLPRVLPAFIHAVADRLATLNWSARGAERVRMRGALAGGAVQVGDVGFVGPAVVEAARLVDSAALRAALTARPDRDFAVGVTDALFQDVVGRDHPGLASEQFSQVTVTVKEYAGSAWVAVPQSRAEGHPAGSAQGPAAVRSTRRT
ncbi:hypothetical protein ACFQ1L_46350 [Phytohabitans flavus]|uniref:hypothetical protein n=1 Tax=Phytohabitans flavus TaxID=1076124 RepID=UPI00362FA799